MRSTQSILIRATPQFLFDLSQDYARRLTWDPFLRSADLLHGATAAGIGVQARCVGHDGLAVETEYVSFHPPQVTAVKMTRGPWVLEAFAGTWRFTAINADTTRVDFVYHLRARPKWLTWIMTPLVAYAFAREMRKRLAALKRAAESV